MTGNPSRSTAAKGTRILAGDDRTRYDAFSVLMHWTTAILVLAQFALAHTWGLASKPTRHMMIVTHMSLGITLSAILIVRITWRLIPGHQVAIASSGPLELAAKAVHYLLYLQLICEAALGFALRWSGKEAMSLFGLLIPPPFAPTDKATHEAIGQAHNIGGRTIIAVAVLHAAAALFHHFVLRDGVLRRMLPGTPDKV